MVLYRRCCGVLTVVLVLVLAGLSPVDGCGRVRWCPRRDTTKPSITCPGDITVKADEKKVYAKVEWNEPIASDNRDGAITPTKTGLGPGNVFFEADNPTKISYSARDRSGNYRSCSFIIRIDVIRCPNWSHQSDGWRSCDPSHDMLRGTLCRFGCYAGHELIGPSQVTCLATGKWETTTQPYCQKKTCEREHQADANTVITCTDSNNYRSVCSYKCEPGFDILPGHTKVRVCSADGTWSGSVPLCVDISPPQYTFCPVVVIGYAERSKTTGRVVWDHPNYDDNDGVAHVTSAQISGPEAWTELEVGEYDMSYLAQDRAGNTDSCNFKVVVKQINCHTLYPLPYTSVACLYGRRYGSSCTFSCKNGSSMTGHEYVQCERDDTRAVPYGQWSFGESQPYCTLDLSCAQPRPPDNGALACDTWAAGRYCQMQCMEGYILPQRDALLLCKDSKGAWDSLGDDQLTPDCSKSNPLLEMIYKLENYFYYEGDCETAKEKIQANFLAALADAHGDICNQNSQCTVDAVEVVCGHTDTREKRSANSETSNIVINSQLKINGSIEADNILNGRLKLTQTTITFTMDDGSVESRGVYVSQPSFTCPDGSYPDAKFFKCVECMPGSFHEKSENICLKCPRGKYQTHAGQTSCEECPEKETTERDGAVHKTECKAVCRPGFSSANGAEPCSECDIGTFADSFGAMSCQSCPGSKTTRTPNHLGGATSQNACYDFDIEYPVTNGSYLTSRVLVKNTRYIRELGVGFWFQCSNSGDSVMSITKEDDSELIMSVAVGQELVINIGSCTHKTGVSLDEKSRWYHAFVEVNSERTALYLDGYEMYNDTQCVHPGMLVTATENMYAIAGGDGYVGSISHLNIWSSPNIVALKQLATCHNDEVGDVLSWKSFRETDGTFVTVHSKCDDYDNCVNGPCNNNGVCTDGLNSFYCACLEGFTDETCGTNIDDCADNSCTNGATCVDEVSGYTCRCPNDFTGSFCETKIVNGNWASYGEWGSCSVTCDVGVQFRSRVCTDPSPDNGGNQCEGDDTDERPCTMSEPCRKECGTDPTVLKNGVMNCEWTDGTTRVCNPECNIGYDFDNDLYLGKIICGPETDYTWNIRNPDNPDADIPMCTEISIAVGNVLNYTSMYSNLTSGMVKSQGHIDSRITETARSATHTITCVQKGDCAVRDIEILNVNEDVPDRAKREIQLVGFSIHISCRPVASISECLDLLTQVKNTLDDYVDQHVFEKDIDSVMYDIDSNGTYIDGISVCNAGKVPVYYYCVPCGLGMYQYTEYCERCPRGSYQDEIGMTHCKTCPDGWSTAGLQSRNVSQCNVYIEDEKHHTSLATILGALAACLVALSVVIVGVFIYKRYLRRRVEQTPINRQQVMHVSEWPLATKMVPDIFSTENSDTLYWKGEPTEYPPNVQTTTHMENKPPILYNNYFS